MKFGGEHDMIYFLTALYYEAKDIISHYKMKKVMKSTRFQVFKGDNELVIISGTSSVKAVVAATYLLNCFEYNEDDIFVNLGICGSVTNNFCKGEAFLCNKLINSYSKRTFYPDMLFEHPFKEAALESFSQVVDKDMRQNINADIVDQEGAFVLEDRTKVRFENKDVITEEEYDVLKILSEKIKLTCAMNIQLEKLSRQYKIRNGHVDDIIKKYTKLQCQSKNEGKRIFGQLKAKLMEL